MSVLGLACVDDRNVGGVLHVIDLVVDNIEVHIRRLNPRFDVTSHLADVVEHGAHLIPEMATLVLLAFKDLAHHSLESADASANPPRPHMM